MLKYRGCDHTVKLLVYGPSAASLGCRSLSKRDYADVAILLLVLRQLCFCLAWHFYLVEELWCFLIDAQRKIKGRWCYTKSFHCLGQHLGQVTSYVCAKVWDLAQSFGRFSSEPPSEVFCRIQSLS